MNSTDIFGDIFVCRRIKKEKFDRLKNDQLDYEP